MVRVDTWEGVGAPDGEAGPPPFERPPDNQEATIEAALEGPGSMWVEVPDLQVGEAAIAEEHAEVRGWAAAPRGIDRVVITVDHGPRLRATYGLARPDLRWCFGEEVAGSCGFTLRLDPAELPPGPHHLTVVALTRGGRTIGMEGSVNRIPYQPPAAPAEIGTPENEAAAERFSPRHHHGAPIEPEHHVRYAWASALVDGLEALDAASGTGWGTARLAERAAKIVGVDISPLAIAEADRDHGGGCAFRVGDLLSLPFADASFDVVVCFEAIEHVADPGVALDEMRRVLRPGGLLLASSPNRGVYPPGNPFHLCEMTSDEFEAALRHRFSNVGVYRQQTYAASLLGPDRALRLDDPRASLDIHVSKLFGERPGSELYTVVAASDNELPPPPGMLALGGRIDHAEDTRQIEMWQERAIKAEVNAAAIRNETFCEAEAQRHTIAKFAETMDEREAEITRLASTLRDSEAQRQELQTQAEEMRTSRSWRMTAPLRALWRSLR